MNILKKLRRWCPQPTKPILTNPTRLSSPVIAAALVVEIVAMLIAPMAYFALFPPTVNYGVGQTFPLTNAQIAVSWPNLPTANQVASVPHVVAGFNALSLSSVKNCTVVNIPDYHSGGLTPVGYRIWLQYNDTWIQVPNAYLATNNPPPIPTLRSGFLGTGLPTVYVIIVVIAIMATLMAGTTYLLMKRKSPDPKATGE